MVTIDVEKLISLAPITAVEMDGMSEQEMWAYLQTLVTGSEFVFAIWHDPAEPNGFGYTCIKGRRRLDADMHRGVRTKGWTVVVPCRDRDRAIYLRRQLGDRLDA